MSIFVQDAASAIAQAVKTTGAWIAWGKGSVAWDSVAEPEPVTATALVAEIGRRRASVIEFVTPSPTGDIVVPQGSFAISAVPTSSLYIRCNFSNTDAVGESIREAAVFIGSTLKGTVPVGQDYFLPADIQSPGVMLMLERFAKIVRSSDFSVSLEFVMTL